jgi:serine O-acetyltransferase
VGLISNLLKDALELSRSMEKKVRGKDPEPTLKQAAKAAATQDGYKVLAMTRIRESARAMHIPGVNHAFRLAGTVLYGIEIGNDVTFGEGVNFAHTLGTVIGGTSRIGNRVKFMGNNTIGTAKDNGCPVIEDDVIVGCGARVLGPIRIGARSIIGANAVVLSDVPPDSVVTGIPAKAVPQKRETGEKSRSN